MKTAAVYRRRGQYYVHSQSETTAGVWIVSEPCFAVAVARDDELATKLLRALDASRSGVAHPTDWKRLGDSFLKLAGMKSWATFTREARRLRVELHDDVRLVLTPTRNLGRGGFEDDAGGVRETTRDDPSALGKLVAQLLDRYPWRARQEMT